MEQARKKRVVIFGATGMLGSAVYGVLKDRYDLVLTVRDPKKIDLLEKAYGGTSEHSVVAFDATRVYDEYIAKKGGERVYINTFLTAAGEVDYVINAIGITIAGSLVNPAQTLFVNGIFPHLLAEVFGEKLIHITTDCAFSGKTGFPYNEDSPKSPTDLYGLSKSIGEPTTALTLRTSIIGRELEGSSGLLDWFLSQAGHTVNGFSNHFWNGITTKQFGKICDQIMSSPERFPRSGIFHVFSTVISKHDMLVKFKEKYGVECEIKNDPEPKLNRTLTTMREMQNLLAIPSFDEMLKEL